MIPRKRWEDAQGQFELPFGIEQPFQSENVISSNFLFRSLFTRKSRKAFSNESMLTACKCESISSLDGCLSDFFYHFLWSRTIFDSSNCWTAVLSYALAAPGEESFPNFVLTGFDELDINIVVDVSFLVLHLEAVFFPYCSLQGELDLRHEFGVPERKWETQTYSYKIFCIIL